MMNSGVEGGESAVKLARKWAYEVKGVEENKAMVIMAKNNFWGRSIAACSSSTDPTCYTNFGPFTPGFETVAYGDIDALRACFESHSERLAAFYVEPVQGEAGVVVPPEGYMAAAKKLCEDHKCLFIADEIQTGLARTGKMLCIEWEGIRPDMVVLGKALSGGMMPVSAVLADDEVMMTLKPGEHGSTYGGNPLACKVAMEALQILVDEKLADSSQRLGEIFRARMMEIKGKHSYVKEVRGRGLLNAVEIDPTNDKGISAWDVCVNLMKNGLLAKPTHDTIIRFAPPLTLTEEQLSDACDIIASVFDQLAAGNKA
jgi:ornithine--oxo-acid transaminase